MSKLLQLLVHFDLLHAVQFYSPYVLTPNSPAGKILMNSRNTLRVLSLEEVVGWLNPSCSVWALDQSNLVWPHVHELYLCIVDLDLAENISPNLSHNFPSTFSFYLPLAMAGCHHDIHDACFVLRLESLQGKWTNIKFATDTGAMLRCAMVFLDNTDFMIPFELYLVPSLECLMLKPERYLLRKYLLKRLSAIMPKLAFLCLVRTSP
ncbi:hypothetical protein BOTBODRAFT_180406 [Botryobasidium botryosum FD-172 SS1]|uniref:F-box domain-containing protein n=1 Tax=Botryobasidium botryosum (strain FD-172 SS1) TaxID=930990 RepID=A0A067LWY9_BOTB1|nr:hypothetical protein BOTBODRAFT_180406 [Botryobasidium botryosum FD-172 SS1]